MNQANCNCGEDCSSKDQCPRCGTFTSLPVQEEGAILEWSQLFCSLTGRYNNLLKEVTKAKDEAADAYRQYCRAQGKPCHCTAQHICPYHCSLWRKE